ncbi:MAG: DUF4837 family protein [Sphingomonadales bacterium]|nr:DUF4837 family protein [Sphingomonadales bacterium]
MKFNTASLLAFAIYLSACGYKEPADFLPTEGSPAEVFAVTHEENQETVKTHLEKNFNRFSPILIKAEQAEKQEFEPSLQFWYGRPESIEGIEKQSPLILVMEVNDTKVGKYSSTLDKRDAVKTINGRGFQLHIYKDVWAKNQTVIRCETKLLTEDFKSLAESLEKEFLENELQQGLPGNLMPNEYCDSISLLIQGKYGFSFAFPPQFRLEFSNPEVAWLWQETSRFYRHVFINIFSDSVLIDNPEKAKANRNYFTGKYVKNTEGTRVVVSESKIFPLTWDNQVKIGKYTVGVLRGWYTEEGTFRRGPFVRYFFHDKSNKRIIAFDGFMHAPDMPKLSFYRTFDLMAASIKFH